MICFNYCSKLRAPELLGDLHCGERSLLWRNGCDDIDSPWNCSVGFPWFAQKLRMAPSRRGGGVIADVVRRLRSNFERQHVPCQKKKGMNDSYSMQGKLRMATAGACLIMKNASWQSVYVSCGSATSSIKMDTAAGGKVNSSSSAGVQYFSL